MNRRMMLFFVAFLLLGIAECYAQSDIRERKQQAPEKRVNDAERETMSSRKEVGLLSLLTFPSAPESLTLCNKPIPLAVDDVRERFEREYYQMLEHRGLLTILVKRYAKYSPILSDEINKMNLPSDLIYLALTESYLNPRAASKANAGGMWQFIKETGKREGLNINDNIDERYSIVRSTKSALGYLKKLNDEFGDWLLVMAAYNCGEARIREAIANQASRDFFELYLPEETDRYIYRIASIKEIITNTKKYGLTIDQREYYKPFVVTECILEVKQEIHTLLLAQAMDMSYKTFRELNLHLRRYSLPKGVYYLYVPSEKKELFFRRIKENPSLSIQNNRDRN
ncbi:MAG TPA: lytic transglycosylase domain-containing protein [Syntrophorhabdales bacterium]|nr:lytic transglycosylase domain-containing protein [Syntrophorhabdales bacterium]